jgi:hypothetical protein
MKRKKTNKIELNTQQQELLKFALWVLSLRNKKILFKGLNIRKSFENLKLTNIFTNRTTNER